jgi:hypothetical protein
MCCPRLYVCLCLFRSSWRPFALDRVVGPDIGQAGMFEEVEHVVASVVDGYRCCIFAYGITGGGKTYTMQGPASGACCAMSLAQSAAINITAIFRLP